MTHACRSRILLGASLWLAACSDMNKPSGSLLADRYPCDQGIGNDPDVVWHEDFEAGSVAPPRAPTTPPTSSRSCSHRPDPGTTSCTCVGTSSIRLALRGITPASGSAATTLPVTGPTHRRGPSLSVTTGSPSQSSWYGAPLATS